MSPCPVVRGWWPVLGSPRLSCHPPAAGPCHALVPVFPQTWSSNRIRLPERGQVRPKPVQAKKCGNPAQLSSMKFYHWAPKSYDFTLFHILYIHKRRLYSQSWMHLLHILHPRKRAATPILLLGAPHKFMQVGHFKFIMYFCCRLVLSFLEK